MFELGNLAFQCSQLSEVRNLNSAKLRLVFVESASAEAILAADLHCWIPAPCNLITPIIWALMKTLFRIRLLLQKVEQTLPQSEGSFGRYAHIGIGYLKKLSRLKFLTNWKLMKQIM